MSKIKTFEEFLSENSIKESAPTKTYNSNILAPMVQDKLSILCSDIIEGALTHQNDSNKEHTLKEYLRESIMGFGGNISRAMNGTEYWNTIGLMSQQVMQAGDSVIESNDKYKKTKEFIKAHLDECHDEMIKAFSDKINEAKKSNETTASLITNKLKK